MTSRIASPAGDHSASTLHASVSEPSRSPRSPQNQVVDYVNDHAGEMLVMQEELDQRMDDD